MRLAPGSGCLVPFLGMIRLYKRRRLFPLGAALLLSGQAASAGPFSWIHEWQSDRSVDAAQTALAEHDANKAALALERALQLNGNNLRALRLLAELAE